MSKKVLVVVDMQVDFVNGSLGFPKAETIVDGVYNKCVEAYAQGDTILFTYDTHQSNYLETREGKNLPVEHCIEGTEGHKLLGKLEQLNQNNLPNMKVLHLQKETFGYVLPHNIITKLIEMGGENEINEIELVGVVTNICVMSNAVTFQSAFPEAKLTVDASLCASFNEDLHEASLDVMEGLQVNVINR